MSTPEVDTNTTTNTNGNPPPTPGGKRTAWLAHVKKTMKANKGKSLKQVLMMAKKTYKSVKRGGSIVPASYTPGGGETQPTTGGRRRSRKGSKKATRKTRRNRKH